MLRLIGYLLICFVVTLTYAQQSNLTDIDLSETSTQHQLIWAVKRRNAIRTFSRSTLLATHADPAAAVESGSLDSVVLVNGQIGSEFWALGSDYLRRRIYYSDYKGNFIGVLNSVNGSHQTLFHGLSFGIDAISVDWYTGNVYWIDTDLSNIFVADTTFKYVAKLQNINSDVPGKLAIDPIRGVMYWSERGDSASRIYRSNLDGTGANLLHNFTDTLSIDEMTIDFSEQRLYFAERLRTTFGSSRIRYFSLNSPNNAQTLFNRTLTWVTGLASYKDVLYVSNRFGRNTIYIYNKTTEAIFQNYQHDSREILRSATVYGPDVQPWSISTQQRHPCNNSPCSHICLPSVNNRGYVCRCGDGFTLADDQTSCFAKPVTNNFVLWSEGRHNNILQLSLDQPGNVALLNITNRRTPRSIQYDPIQQQVYWSDPLSGTISRADLDGSNQEVIFENVPTFAIGLDIASRTIYIANSISDFMLVGSMDLPNITTTLHVSNIYTVFQMVVSNRLGKVFWCDGGPTSGGRNLGRIESMNLDGSGRTIIRNLTNSPNSIAIDEIGNFVYWTQVFSNKIYWLDMNGGLTGEYVVSQSNAQSQLTQAIRGAYYFNHSIYVTPVSGSRIYKIATETILLNNTETALETLGTETLFSISAITFYSNTSEPQDSSACTVNRGGCPEICVPSPTNTATCLCAHHSVYVSQNNSCTQVYIKDDIERPSFGDTCPRTITLLEVKDCGTTAEFDFDPPTATDNSGRVVVTSTVNGQPPYNLTAGLHFFTYRATDYHGNSASCRFYVTVRDQKCIRPPFIPNNSVTSQPTCGNSIGSVINVTCTTNNRPSFQYVCNSNGAWEPSTLPICPAETTTTTATTTTAAATTTTRSTTTPSPIQSTTNTLPGASKSVIFVTGGSDPDGSAEKSQLLTTAGQTVQGPVQPSTLNGGLVALIVILVILLIVGVVFMMYRYGRNGLAFKHVLWTRSQDRVTLASEDGTNVQYRGMHED